MIIVCKLCEGWLVWKDLVPTTVQRKQANSCEDHTVVNALLTDHIEHPVIKNNILLIRFFFLVRRISPE